MISFERGIVEAIKLADFKLFRKFVKELDAVHALCSQSPNVDIAPGADGSKWNMTLPNFGTTARIKAVISITGQRSFQQGHADMLRLMVDRGVDLDSIADDHGTFEGSAVTSALRNGTPEMLKFVFELGANADYQYGSKSLPTRIWTPVRNLFSDRFQGSAIASENEISKKLDVLLNAGASLDSFRARHMETPLCVAANSGRWNAVLVLLNRGENPFEVSESDGLNAFEQAKSSSEQLFANMVAWCDAKKAVTAIDEIMSKAGLSAHCQSNNHEQGNLIKPARASSASAGQGMAKP